MRNAGMQCCPVMPDAAHHLAYDNPVVVLGDNIMAAAILSSNVSAYVWIVRHTSSSRIL